MNNISNRRNYDVVNQFREFSYKNRVRTNEVYNSWADKHPGFKEIQDATIHEIRVYTRSSILTATAKLSNGNEIGLCWLNRI